MNEHTQTGRMDQGSLKGKVALLYDGAHASSHVSRPKSASTGRSKKMEWLSGDGLSWPMVNVAILTAAMTQMLDNSRTIDLGNFILQNGELFFAIDTPGERRASGLVSPRRSVGNKTDQDDIEDERTSREHSDALLRY